MAVTYETREHPSISTFVQVRAFEDGRSIGQLTMSTDRKAGYLIIVGIYVDPKKQKQGIGKAMHLAAMAEAQKRGLLVEGIALTARLPGYSKVWDSLKAQRESIEVH